MIWEYKTAINDIKEFNITETEKFLNIMGKDKWELVSVNEIAENGNTIKMIYLFKRPTMAFHADLQEIGYDIDNNGIAGSQL